MRVVAHVERLPPPPGDHAAGAAAPPAHRGLPDPPLDLRPPRRTDRRAAFPAESLPASRQAAAGNWNGLLFAGPRSANADLGGMNIAGDLRLLRLQARQASRSTSATTTGRPSSRFTSRTTTSCRSTRARQLRHLRRPDLAVRRLVFGAARRHHDAAEIRLEDLRALAAGGARLLQRTSRSRARCG